MGGSMGVTIRTADGTEHRMCRWTNPTPFFVTNVKLCLKDEKHIKNYIKQWTNMVKDWQSAKGAMERTKYPMSSVYAPYPYLAPHDYGLLVVDLQRDLILHMQGYTDYYGTLYSTGVSPEKEKNLRGFARLRRIKSFTYYGDHGACVSLSGKHIRGPYKTIEEGFYTLDMSPFTLERFEESPKGARLFRKRLESLDFALSSKEQKLWREWVKELTV